MNTKLKHFFLLAALSLASIACSSGLAKPVSGLDLSLLPARMLSISPAPAVVSKTPEAPLRTTEAKTTNQTATVNN
ncbi:MAG TPA: hypothetical protein PK228_03550 [Saprospiraceae bacterium]|nr:hypothetical protein [Saprospiraceae bacterium]